MPILDHNSVRITSIGSITTLCRTPRHEYLCQLTGAIPEIAAAAADYNCALLLPAERRGAAGFQELKKAVRGTAVVKADGLLLRRGQTVVVQMRDCVPIVVSRGDYAVVLHGGREALTETRAQSAAPYDIISRGVEALMKAAPHGPLSAWVGPCICASCYSLDAAHAQQLRRGGFFSAPVLSDNNHLDLRAHVVERLRDYDIALITLDRRCTKCDPSLASCRGDGVKSQLTNTFIVEVGG